MIRQPDFKLLQATDAFAVVGVETPAALSTGEPMRIEAELYGPHCSSTRTLCAAYSARCVSGADDSPQRWEIAVPDPCYWTSELPFLYDLTFYDRGPDPQLERSRLGRPSWLGLRGLEAYRRDLRLENRRFVLRGVATPHADLETQAIARSLDAALWTADVDDRQLEAAAREGTWIVVDLRNHRSDIRETLAHLAWNPAVAIAALSRSQLAAGGLLLSGASVDRSARRLLLAQCVDPQSDAPLDVAEDADLLVWEISADRPQPPNGVREASLPLVALDRTAAYRDLASARRGCDRLQAGLAPLIDFAGYFTEFRP